MMSATGSAQSMLHQLGGAAVILLDLRHTDIINQIVHWHHGGNLLQQ